MGTFIKSFKDRLGNIIYPQTKEMAVYDESGARLDNKLSKLNSIVLNLFNITSAKFVTDFNSGNGLIEGRWKVYNADGTSANAPYTGACRGYVDVVVDGNPTVNGTPIYQTFTDYYGNTYYKIIIIGTNFGSWKKQTNSDIVQSDIVTDFDKVPSAYVMSVVSGRVNTLTGNLLKYTMTPVGVSTQANLDSLINNIPSVNSQWYRTTVNITVELALSGGVWYIEGYRTSENYEWQKATSYLNLGGTREVSRTKWNGTWGAWVDCSSISLIAPTVVSTYGGLHSGGYNKTGRVTTITTRVTITTQVPALTEFMSGFPISVSDFAPLSCMGTNGSPVTGLFTNSGAIKSNAILPVGNYIISGSYITT